VRAVAGRNAASDADGLNRMASSCLALFVGAGGVAMTVGVPVLFALSGTLSEKADGDPGVLPFMLLMLANVAMGLPLSVFPSVLDGLERYTAKSVVRLAALAARTGGDGVRVTAFGGLFPLAVVYTVVTLIEHAVLALLCRRFLPASAVPIAVRGPGHAQAGEDVQRRCVPGDAGRAGDGAKPGRSSSACCCRQDR